MPYGHDNLVFADETKKLRLNKILSKKIKEEERNKDYTHKNTSELYE